MYVVTMILKIILAKNHKTTRQQCLRALAQNGYPAEKN